MDGRGVDLSGGGGASIDLSGGRGVDLSGGAASSPPPAAAAQTSASTAGGFAGQMGANVMAATVQNPQVQEAIKARASEAATQGWEAAKVGGVQAASELHKYVQEGPAGISILCFLGGCATSVVGALGMLNLGQIFSDPFHYVLSIYLFGFGLVATLLEADVDMLSGRAVIGKLAPLAEHYQEEIFIRAKFLTELRGRGLFYAFIGTLSITQCWFCLFFLAGLWNLLMGVLCLMMSFGINPGDHLPQHGSFDQQPFNQSPGFSGGAQHSHFANP